MSNRAKREFEELCDDASEKLRSYVYCMCRDTAETDDLLQECYLRALRNWKQFKGQGSREGWLFGIARRVCIDWYRANKNRTLPKLANPGEIAVARNAEEPSVKLADVWRVVDKLDEHHRQIMYLRFAGGLGYLEISKALGVPIGTVRSRLHRALKQVQERLR